MNKLIFQGEEEKKAPRANEQTDKEVIDSHLFVESIALISLHINKSMEEEAKESVKNIFIKIFSS